MRLISLDLLSLTLDSPLPRRATQRDEQLHEFAAWLADGEDGLGLRSDQIRLWTWDTLFGYELSAQFFGDNGHIVRTADRVRVSIRNCRTVGDWELVRHLLVKLYQRLDLPPQSITSFQAQVHSRLPSADELEAFFRQYPQPVPTSKPALFTYLKVNDWEADIRLFVEKSNALPDALYLLWETQFPNAQDWETFIGTLPTVMESAVQPLDLGFMPMPRSV